MLAAATSLNVQLAFKDRVNKTHALAKTMFYWPNMYADARRSLSHCLQCQTHAPRKAKSKIQGHIMASAAGQVWMLDVLRLEHSIGGDHHLLCMVVVFSRYAIV